MEKEASSQNLQTFLTFLRLLEQFSTDHNEYEKILHPDFHQIEYPNLLTKNGQERNLKDSFRGIDLAGQLLSEQKYELIRSLESGDNLVLEVVWTGVMAVDAGVLKKGMQMKAYICMVVEFEDGRIIRQRNYDCYEPFA